MVKVSNFGSAIIKIFTEGKGFMEMFRALQPFKVAQSTVSKTTKWYKETHTIESRKRSGRPRSVRTPELVKEVREKIRRSLSGVKDRCPGT